MDGREGGQWTTRSSLHDSDGTNLLCVIMILTFVVTYFNTCNTSACVFSCVFTCLDVTSIKPVVNMRVCWERCVCVCVCVCVSKTRFSDCVLVCLCGTDCWWVDFGRRLNKRIVCVCVCVHVGGLNECQHGCLFVCAHVLLCVCVSCQLIF